MLPFPAWSDLGRVSSSTRASWEGEFGIREKYRRYFDGDIFKERVEVEGVDHSEAPLLYPLGLNLVKMLCIAQTDALFGEWEDQIVRFEVRSEVPSSGDHEKAIEMASLILNSSNANSMLWEIALERNVYGGGAIKVTPGLAGRGHIRWTRVPLESFFPIWDPDDPNELLEVWIVIQMTAEQARAKYGFSASAEVVTRVEHWTKAGYENLLEGRRMEAYSGVNPWGFVPFVYIPHCRTDHFWGLSLTEDIIPAQDELNGVLADAGEAINYNAHPIRWGVNLPRAFNQKNFAMSPNAMWDLGRTLPGAEKPEIGILEAQRPVPPETFSYVKFIYDWTRTAAFTPPIAFGEDNGGGQRSGQTLEIRMIPMIRANKRSRAYMGEGLAKLLWMAGKILQQKRFDDVPARAVEKFIDGSLIPAFAPIMPQDHQGIVDEVVKLMATEPHAISLETSQKILGRGTGEVARIKEDLRDEELKSDEQKAQEDAVRQPSLPGGQKAEAAPGQKGSAKGQVLNAQKGKMQPQARKESA
jgi:hypothetical protein